MGKKDSTSTKSGGNDGVGLLVAVLVIIVLISWAGQHKEGKASDQKNVSAERAGDAMARPRIPVDPITKSDKEELESVLEGLTR